MKLPIGKLRIKLLKLGRKINSANVSLETDGLMISRVRNHRPHGIIISQEVAIWD